MKDLTSSDIERKNILNNKYAIERINQYIGFEGFIFDGEIKYLNKMVAEFYEIDERTLRRYLEKYESELKSNGYVLIKGKLLKNLKLQLPPDINVRTNTTVLGLFNFRAFLNLGMLLVESERAKLLRSKILDIVIDVVNEKTGGGTKYINRRDQMYIPSALEEDNYRKLFTDALNKYVDLGNYKYVLYTNKIYEYVFREKATEYRDVLRLKQNENIRNTFYSEILDLVASFEAGLAEKLETEFTTLGRKLKQNEANIVFDKFASQSLYKPLIQKARTQMASRDLCFREAFHKNLERYITSVSIEDFEKFLGENSMDFDKQLSEARDVFERLKDSE